ncbi:hypothetical protein PIROE2DRAFT_9458 [Piromyces sp. E2]|nr:hypothetical protein PIROE2DRAFT_9458 [Piromyces sp. E2]|eukprot:OUM63927.1 hypothetical protein PIROE2DRAFT_9458 [Piromyces sp. E2]
MTKIFISEVLFNFIYDIKKSEYEDELIVNFVDPYYDMSSIIVDIIMPIDIDVTFRGNENGTIFDYKNEVLWGELYYFYETGKTFKLENIIFENFCSKYLDHESVSLIELYATFNNFSVIAENCVFKNNYSSVFLVSIIDPCDLFSKCENNKYNYN